MIFFLIYLSSCTPARQAWKLTTITATFPCSTYAKAYLQTCNPFNGLEVELLCNGADTTLFLNALMLCFPPAQNDSGKIDVDICIEDQSFQYPGDRYEGGQRIRLPEEAKQLIIASLLEDIPVTIAVGRYQAIIYSENFKKVYHKLLEL